jgi:hypothetical protein
MADRDSSPNFTPSDHDMLIRLDTKIDFLLAALSGKADQRDVTELRDKVQEQEGEIKELKDAQTKFDEFRWRSIGWAAGAGTAAAGLISYAFKFLPGAH